MHGPHGGGGGGCVRTADSRRGRAATSALDPCPKALLEGEGGSGCNSKGELSDILQKEILIWVIFGHKSLGSRPPRGGGAGEGRSTLGRGGRSQQDPFPPLPRGPIPRLRKLQTATQQILPKNPLPPKPYAHLA